ncbi:MAG: NAD-dependent epimerase/dehydratase family protein [Flavobacteriales bacterium]
MAKLKVLLLGGGSFLGKNMLLNLVESEEFELSVLNRGKTQTEIHDSVNYIKADRDFPCAALSQVHYDIVLDFSCYFPQQLRNVLQNLGQAPSHYIFISTCSVYDNENVTSINRNESCLTLTCSKEEERNTDVSTYGQRKAECERILIQSGIPHTIYRPALVFGAFDPTDRLYYWLHQIKTQKELLLPDSGERIFSLTYVHDVVSSIRKSIQTEASNTTYNMVSYENMSVLELITVAEKTLDLSPTHISISPDLLSRCGVNQWTDMPLWLNTDIFTFTNEALRTEFDFKSTPFQEALNDTIAYYENLNWPSPVYGMPETKRQDLINQVKSLC